MIDKSNDGQILQLGYQAFADSIKQGMDYVKHLTTLSAGAIVLIGSFLSEIFKPPDMTTVPRILELAPLGE